MDNVLLTKIARMYYELDMTQSQIAKEIYMSRSQVSRALDECRKRGIIEIKIRNSLERTSFLESEIKKRFNVGNVVILDNDLLDYEESINQVARFGAKYIENVLKDDMVVGITWGKTLKNVIKELSVSKNYSKMKIISIAGSVNNKNQEIDGPHLAKEFAFKYNCEYYHMIAPLYAGSKKMKELFLANDNIKMILEMSRNSNIIIGSVGNLLDWQEIITEKNYYELLEKNAIGHIVGYFYDIYGNIVNTKLHNNIIAVEPKILKNKDIHKIIVASGINKAESIIGALRGGFITTLITDAHTACKVLEINFK